MTTADVARYSLHQTTIITCWSHSASSCVYSTMVDWAWSRKAGPSVLAETCNNLFLAIGSALMLLVGRQEGHPACKKTEWWNVGVVVWDEVQICIWPRICHCHSLSLVAPVNPDWFYLPGFYLSGTRSPRWSRTNSRTAVKRLCVCVCIIMLLWNAAMNAWLFLSETNDLQKCLHQRDGVTCATILSLSN